MRPNSQVGLDATITHGPRWRLTCLLCSRLAVNVTPWNSPPSPARSSVSSSNSERKAWWTLLTSTPIGLSTKTGMRGSRFSPMNFFMYQRIVCVRPTANAGTSSLPPRSAQPRAASRSCGPTWSIGEWLALP
jgi:hypothetical protein